MRLRTLVSRTLVASVLFLAAWAPGLTAQEAVAGENVVPVYEGWERNDDGSINLIFGYYNRNWEEQLHVPIGEANRMEPGNPDQGQPTYFYPRRNRFIFRIRVPGDFGDKELVWTLATNGKTERTYATLKPGYFVDKIVVMNNNGAGGSGGGGYNINENQTPTLKVDGPKTRSARVGEPVVLTAFGNDDGVPKRRMIRLPFGPQPQAPGGEASGIPANYRMPRVGSRCCADSASGLRLAWYVYRGVGEHVAFDPEQISVWEDYRDGRNSPYSAGWEPPAVPEDGKYVSRVTFTEPGSYVLRVQLHDGGLDATDEITFNVTR